MKVPTILNAPRQAPNLQLGGVTSSVRSNGTEQLGESLAYLGRELQKVQDEKEKQQIDLDKFELNQSYLEELNESELEFKEAKESAPAGAANFALGWQARLEEKHAKKREEMAAYGYRDEELRSFDLQLAGIRGKQFGESLTFQEQQERVKAGSDIGRSTDELGRYYVNNPNATGSVKEELRSQIWLHPHLNEGEKQQLFDEQWGRIRTIGAEAYAISNPDATIKALDPDGRYAKTLNPAGGGTEGGTAAGAGARPSGYQGTAYDVAKHFGMKPEEVAAVFSYETAGTFDPNIQSTAKTGSRKGQTFLGLIQFGEEERKKYKIGKNSTPDQWTTAIINYMTDRGFKPGMSLLDFYSTINAGRPGKYGASDGNGTVSSHTDKLSRQHLKPATAWLAKGAPVVLNNSLPTPGEVIASPTAEFDAAFAGGIPAEGAEVSSEQPEAFNYKTGIAPLDELRGDEQLALLGKAYGTKRVNTTEEKAAALTQHENEKAVLSQGGTPPAGISDERGVELFGATRWEQMQGEKTAITSGANFMSGLTTASPQVIRQRLDALKPTNVSSPTYATDLKNWEAMQSVASENLAARERDPYAYAVSSFPNVTKAFSQAKTSQGRKAAYNALYSAYDTMGVPEDQRYPMSKPDMDRAIENYNTLSPGERLAQFDTWLREMGPGFKRFAGYSSTTAGALGTDAFMYSQFVGHPEFVPVMRDLMLGENRIAKDPALRPEQATVNNAFIGDPGLRATMIALNPGASGQYNKAAGAVYVGRGGGTTATGGRTALTSGDLYKESLRTVFGGLPGNPDTGLVQLHGKKNPYTILPPTVTKGEWNNWVETLTPQTLHNAAVEKYGVAVDKYGKPVRMSDVIDSGIFVMTAPGYYMILSPLDNKPLLTVRGAPYIIQVTPETVRKASRPVNSGYTFSPGVSQ